MTAPDPRAEALRWWRQAEEDLDTARKLAEIGKHYAACFFSQQAAEKAIKAVLYRRGAEIVRGHSVAELLEALAGEEPSFAGLRSQAAPLDAYYVPTRYPNGLAGGHPFEAYGPHQSQDALSLADAVFAAVRARLSTP